MLKGAGFLKEKFVYHPNMVGFLNSDLFLMGI